MLFKELAHHQWKYTWRSPGLYGSLIQKIMMWIGVIYFGVIALIMGLLLTDMLEDTSYKNDYWEMVAAGFGYYILIGIACRMTLQTSSLLNPQPYYLMPIKRIALVRFITLRPLINPFNYFILILFLLPFLIKELSGGYINYWIFLSMLLTGFLASWINILLSAVIKRYTTGKTLLFISLLALPIGMLILDYFGIIHLYSFFLKIIPPLIRNGLSIIIMLVVATIAYKLNIWYFSKNYYDENFQKEKNRLLNNIQFSFLDRLGEVGNYLSFMLKIIFRHKRTRATAISAIVFLFYGLLLYNPMCNPSQGKGLMFFSALFITGSPMLMLQQFLFGWNASYFDFLMTKNFNTKTYLKAHYLFMVISCIVWFILSTPYFLQGIDFVILHTSALLYNIGFNTIFLLLCAPYNTKKMSLDSKSSMNYQGTTYKNFLIIIPMTFFPWIFIGIMGIFYEWQTSVYILGVFGLLCLLLHKPIFKIVEKNFLTRKYTLCEGFRVQA